MRDFKRNDEIVAVKDLPLIRRCADFGKTIPKGTPGRFLNWAESRDNGQKLARVAFKIPSGGELIYSAIPVQVMRA